MQIQQSEEDCSDYQSINTNDNNMVSNPFESGEKSSSYRTEENENNESLNV